ncbi:MAG: hypothetical protein M3142_09610 [Bacteroidota bacterium]|nr:hypothetical protein [Bacteroidota bacterium]
MVLVLHSFGASAQDVKVFSLSEAVDLGVRNSKNLKFAQSKIDLAEVRYIRLWIAGCPQGVLVTLITTLKN